MSTNYEKAIEEIQVLCKSIRVGSISDSLVDELSYAKEKGLPYEEFLLRLLRIEQHKQAERGKQKRIRNAGSLKKCIWRN